VITMIIGVTGGKGGVGKSTLSVGIVHALVKHGYKVLLVDADVECPNDHLLLGIQINEMVHAREVTVGKPVINEDECIKCGVCVRTCRESALFQLPGQVPQLLSDQCIGCGACSLACPVKAITEIPERVGDVYRYDVPNTSGRLTLLTGMLKPGYEEASPVVNVLMDVMEDVREGFDYVIVDTAPGTHCNVISSLRHVDRAIAVTEPTPLGAHDLDLILTLGTELKVPMSVVINRSGIGDETEVDDVVSKHDVPVLGRIPYDKRIFESYVRGEPIEHETINDIVNRLTGG